MVTADDEGIYLLHYAIKTSNMSQENRATWLKNLKDSSIKEDSGIKEPTSQKANDAVGAAVEKIKN